ncbi:MAG: hypothetical protein CME34_05290 [Gordonia sp.]|uniref:hypothetical protein n=1 Tax=Gordonia sp. (in: high G+C Gram-positive bacteria) TaxID=84139 RepID=UPI000C611C92|nr:hypothetical protein [Gordonia sp. (in: high G+C Gram-positive bacteria)]MAU81276.1 hypothetical protein [Gordonia sp. (in: high G+C Gram-positive bacteria)]
MTRTIRRIAIGSAVAALSAAMLAPTASAAPADVTATPTVNGNTVSLTVQNDSAKRVGCEIFGVPADTAPSAGQISFGYQTPEQLSALITPGSSKKLPMRVPVSDPPRPTGSTTIPDGNYDIYWGCRTITIPPVDAAAEEYWGTTPPLPAGAATGDAPIRVEVPGEAPTSTTPKPETTVPPAIKEREVCVFGYCLSIS